MNIFFDVVLFIVSLAINSLLPGFVVAGGTAMAFQLIRNSFPRLRYTLAVAAFLIAAFVPVAVTLAGADEPQSPPITITDTERGNSSVVSSDDQSGAKLLSDSAAQDRTMLSPRTNLLNDLTLYVGGSWVGTLFSGIWFFVSIHLLVREITAYRRLRIERKRWRLANAEQRSRFFCPDSVKLYFAEEGFFTTGFLSSVVVLPHHFPDNLSRLSIRGIVLHEIAHAKWRDACINSLLRIVRGFFWVNPSLWFLNRIIRAEREAAADRSALLSLSNSGEAGEANADYATAIVSVAKLSVAGSSQQHRLSAVMHFGKATNLENRIHRILNVGSQSSWVRLSSGFAVLLTSVLALTIIPVASIPLTTVQAEISPYGFSDTAELSVFDSYQQDASLQWNDYASKGSNAGQGPVNVVMRNMRSSTPENEKTKDQDGKITLATQVVEQKEVKVNEPRIQPNSSGLNPSPRIVYQGDSAKPIIRPVRLEINRDIRPADIRPVIHRVYSPEPVMRVVVRPVVRLDYTK